MGGGGSAGKASSKLKSMAKSLHIWASWCDIRADEEWDAGNHWEAAKWEAEGVAAEAEADAYDVAAAAAEKAGL
jgi:hypothetical protein